MFKTLQFQDASIHAYFVIRIIKKKYMKIRKTLRREIYSHLSNLMLYVYHVLLMKSTFPPEIAYKMLDMNDHRNVSYNSIFMINCFNLEVIKCLTTSLDYTI